MTWRYEYYLDTCLLGTAILMSASWTLRILLGLRVVELDGEEFVPCQTS